jgi:DnaJ-domain-containing protein 1
LADVGGLVSPSKISLHEIDAALEKFEVAAPPVKRDILRACARAIASDGELSSREAELLRAMADGIGCSIPPWVEDLEHKG